MKEVVKKKLNIRPYLEKLGFDTSKNLTECKFHNSKNKQDFSWNEEMYHCFGCGAKGDVLDLIARLNGLDIKRDFIKVLKIAANDAGVKLDITEKYADKLNKEKEREEKLKKSHNLFLNWCISQMDDIQTNYIINKRKISKETINRFKIGYFPQNKIYELKKYLLENNVSSDLIEKYMYLSERHIIPFLRNGDAIHFVGHKIPSNQNENTGKYVVMNSDYSADKYKPLFNENDLYNTKFLLITEGYYDTISVANINYNNNKIKTIGFGTNHFSRKVLENKGYLFSKLRKIIISFDNEKNNQGLQGSIETAINLLEFNTNIYINQIHRGNKDKLDICDALAKYENHEDKYNYIYDNIIDNKENTKHIFNIISSKLKKENSTEQITTLKKIYDIIFNSKYYDVYIKTKIIDDLNKILTKKDVFEKELLRRLKLDYLKNKEDVVGNGIEINQEVNDNRESIHLNKLIQNTEEIINKIFSKVPMVYDDKGVLHVWNEKKKSYEIKDHDFTIDYIFDNEYYVYDKPICHAETRGILHRAIHQAATKYFIEHMKLPKKDWISFKDCIIDIKTGEIISRNVKDYFMHNTLLYEVLPKEESEEISNFYDYYKDKKLDTPNIDKFFKEWINDKTKTDIENENNYKLLNEITAYSFYSGYPYARIFCLLGTGRNGKSTYLDLLIYMLGEHNFVSKKISDISNNRFSKVGLYKKLLCSMGEAKYSDKTNEGILKDLTGGDYIEGEMKNIQGGVLFKNYAKIFLNTQDIPQTNDFSDGYMRRWTIINFPNNFPQKKDILAPITNEELKNYMIKSMFLLKDLLSRDGEVIFTNEGTIEEKKLRFKKLVNPLIEFVDKYCTQHYNEYISTLNFYTIFNKYQMINKQQTLSEKQIKDNLQSIGIYLDRMYIDGVRKSIFRGISCELDIKDITEYDVAKKYKENKIDYNKEYTKEEMIPILKNKFPSMFNDYDLLTDNDKTSLVDRIIDGLKKNTREIYEVKPGKYKLTQRGDHD